MADRLTDRLDSNLGAAPDVFWHLTVELCYRYNDAIRDMNDVPRVLFQADQHQCRVVGIDVVSLSSSAQAKLWCSMQVPIERGTLRKQTSATATELPSIPARER
jgi:hypothetical protein